MCYGHTGPVHQLAAWSPFHANLHAAFRLLTHALGDEASLGQDTACLQHRQRHCPEALAKRERLRTIVKHDSGHKCVTAGSM